MAQNLGWLRLPRARGIGETLWKFVEEEPGRTSLADDSGETGLYLFYTFRGKLEPGWGSGDEGGGSTILKGKSWKRKGF